MPVRMTGAQYKAFLASEWGPAAYWEETEILKNGESVDDDNDSAQSFYADTDTVTIICGTIIPDQSLPPMRQERIDAVKFARKWLKAQSTVTLMVDVPRSHADYIARLINETGISAGMAKVVGRIG